HRPGGPTNRRSTMRTRRATLIPLLVLACNGAAERDGAPEAAGAPMPAARPTPPDCPRVETRPPNAPDQRPAFPGQTRACAVDSDVEYDVVVLARGLEHPWAVEPLPDGDLLVTERPGRMRVVTAAGQVGEPIEGLPRVDAR